MAGRAGPQAELRRRRICETGNVDGQLDAVIAEAVAVLRQAGARFAYLHGSRAAGRERVLEDDWLLIADRNFFSWADWCTAADTARSCRGGSRPICPATINLVSLDLPALAA
jgi:hypothetical protein